VQTEAWSALPSHLQRFLLHALDGLGRYLVSPYCKKGELPPPVYRDIDGDGTEKMRMPDGTSVVIDGVMSSDVLREAKRKREERRKAKESQPNG
jgi:hypothetical protein